jgi:potassium-transporting ATPase KdpC subunit
MRNYLYRSVMLMVLVLAVCGLAYPLAGVALSDAAFHYEATGSIGRNGSTLIGQPWNDGTSIDPRWFNGRPDPDNPLELNGVAGTSGAANLGPKSLALVVEVRGLIDEWHRVGVDPTPDLVTTSASGLDPDLTPQDAMVQIPMIARARHLRVATLLALVRSQTHGAQLGFLGGPYVDVLSLNEALAALHG